MVVVCCVESLGKREVLGSSPTSCTFDFFIFFSTAFLFKHLNSPLFYNDVFEWVLVPAQTDSNSYDFFFFSFLCFYMELLKQRLIIKYHHNHKTNENNINSNVAAVLIKIIHKLKW